jgi:signal transduction histidine kinase/CheY-like chemotaxis protein
MNTHEPPGEAERLASEPRSSRDVPSDLPWYASLVTRQVVLYSLLTAGLIALLGFLSYRGSREALLKTEEAALRHAAETVRLKIQAAIRDLVRDTVQLSRSPTLREYLKHENTADAAQWKGFVEDAFRAALEGKPDYFQVRLIGVTTVGRELIRLDNHDGFIVATPPEKLQLKGDRDYFRDALRTPGGAVYLSEINLNRDFGRITDPHIPTLRTVKIIETEEGTLHSLLVINADLRDVFREVTNLAGTEARLALATMTGDYLIHSDPSRTFGSDLGTTWKFTTDFAPPDSIPLETEKWRLEDHDGEFRLLARFPLTPESSRQLVVALTQPAEALTAGLRAARDRAVRLTALAAVGGILLVVLLARLLAARLRQLTYAVAHYELERGITGLPEPGRDEVGMLAARFQELDEKVRESLKRTQAAVRAREDFLAVMSHEIRTPMNAVTGLVRALEQNAPAPHQAPILRSLGAAARNLMGLLDDALDYSKLRAGHMHLVRAPLALPEFLQEAAQTHTPLAEQKGLRLELKIDPNIPAAVFGDRLRLGQVLHNLLSNALKFTSVGTIRLEAKAQGNRVHFAVADSGSGIPKEMLGRIFDPFDQTSPEIAQRFGGTGLGLSITRELVRMMGGEITVVSTEGEGSIFSFALPLEPAPAPPAATSIAAPSLVGRRILYIEDVASNREVMALTLQPTGVTLITANTGAEGLAVLSRESFDVILLDLQLPDTSGHALAPKLRAVRDVPIIAVTAQATPKAREECAAAGMAGMVTKPIEPESLGKALSSVLGGAVSFTALEATFGKDPARLQRVLELLKSEFEHYEKNIAEALASEDIEALRQTKHKMHTAMEELGLVALRESLERIIAGTVSASAEGSRCLTEIVMARKAIAQKLEAATLRPA